MVKIVGALAGLKPEGQPVYNDIDATARYGGWVAAAYQEKLIGPDAADPLRTDPTFLGDQPVTRAEAVMFVANWLAVRS